MAINLISNIGKISEVMLPGLQCNAELLYLCRIHHLPRVDEVLSNGKHRRKLRICPYFAANELKDNTNSYHECQIQLAIIKRINYSS